jgi:predicted aspartyl protease
MSGHRLPAALAAATLLVMVGAHSAQAQAPPAEAPPLVETAAEATVETTMSASDRMLVPVTIGGAGPYPFIVDTAAESSVIARDLARELGLAPEGRARLLSMTSSREIGMVRMPGVSFMQGEARSLRAFALNGENLGASGILGIDALRGQRVVLDFEAGEMRVGEAPRRNEGFGPDDIVVRGRSRYGQLVLIDSTAEDVPVDVIVDSGLQVSVGNEPLRRLLTSRRSALTQVELISITGESFTADYTRVDNLRIGGVAIAGMPVAFANAHFFRRMRLTRRPALLLGMDALQMFRRVAVDFPNRRAHFVLPSGAARTG